MKGVFCLEGFWSGDHRDEASVSPILELVKKYNKIPSIHHRCGTKEELLFGIQRWRTKSFNKEYHLLYLAFHGIPGEILIDKDAVTLEQLADLLEGKCKGSIIYFGSCSTFDVSSERLQAFLRKTKALAIMGYREDVDWLPSASFEIILIDRLINNSFDAAGLKQVKKELARICKGYVHKLDFAMVLKKKVVKKAHAVG